MLEPTVIPVPTLHQPLHSKVSNYLNDQRRTGQFCDLKIELENGENFAWAHYCVVGAQSEFIGGCHLLQQSAMQFSIQNPLKVTIKNFSCAQCLESILDFFYEDIVTIATEHEKHFKNLSKILAVTELMKVFPVTTEMDEAELPVAADSGDVYIENAGGKVTLVNGDALNHNDINVTIENVFEQRNYFKVNNVRNNNSYSGSKINYCIGCDFKCYRVHEMISHMGSCEASHLTCSLCEVGFLSWRHYDAHLKKHSSNAKKPFFCFECDTRFMTRAALLVHHPKHSTEAPYSCPICSKSFKWKHALSNHLLIHNSEKQMLCDVCGFSASHMKSLKAHKLSHTGDTFKCTFPGCSHKSNRKENLKIHMDTHKQERPFVCEVCGYKFSQSKNLKRHALKHSTDDDIKKHKCQLCSFASHRSDKLKEHMQRVHTEKAIQLELPEIVENSFENQIGFDLPPLPMETLLEICEARNKNMQSVKRQTVNNRKKKKKQQRLFESLPAIRPKMTSTNIPTTLQDVPILTQDDNQCKNNFNLMNSLIVK